MPRALMPSCSSNSALPCFADHPLHARALIAAALAAADPARALAAKLDVPGSEEVVLLAVGKAARFMALEALARLDHRVVAGIITAPPEHTGAAAFSPWPVEVFPCDHPLPTPRNTAAATKVRDLVAGVTPSQRLVLLISGGGSAYLCLPAPGIQLDDLTAITNALQRAGATIHELNTVRKHCEQLKGGRLGALSPARHLHAFILSDVMGDPLDTIASGPAAPDRSTYTEALRVLEKHGLVETAPAITNHLRRGSRVELPDTPKPGDPVFSRVTSTIIANNATVLRGVAEACRGLGFAVAGIDQVAEGDAAVVGRRLTAKAAQLPGTAPACYILGGETTVNVGTCRGKGGPSQEMALAFAAGLPASLRDVALLTFSTDGRDGPTDAAGAVVSSETPAHARSKGMDLAAALAAHDSHTALDRLGVLIRTAPTGTNLNHVAVVLAYSC